MSLIPGHVYLAGRFQQPVLEVYTPAGDHRHVPFIKAPQMARRRGDVVWQAEPVLPDQGEWSFRVALTGNRFIAPKGLPVFITQHRSLWIQKRQLFPYRPALKVSPARVVKIPTFTGGLSTRALYIYLPRGYDEHRDRAYPVLFMHDGQNCFEAYAADSFAGSWHADEVATRLIAQGRMRETLIIGVSNGQAERIWEYLPPYAALAPPTEEAEDAADAGGSQKLTAPVATPIPGRAAETYCYYRDDVASYLNTYYRTLSGRENRATCGSSLGGLFSFYLAWEQPEFARHHAAMSSSFWATRNQAGKLAVLERVAASEWRDVRLWLDSGTGNDSTTGDDNRQDTLTVQEALTRRGYVDGADFHYHLAEGAGHNESAWAARLPEVFAFLLPSI